MVISTTCLGCHPGGVRSRRAKTTPASATRTATPAISRTRRRMRGSLAHDPQRRRELPDSERTAPFRGKVATGGGIDCLADPPPNKVCPSTHRLTAEVSHDRPTRRRPDRRRRGLHRRRDRPALRRRRLHDASSDAATRRSSRRWSAEIEASGGRAQALRARCPRRGQRTGGVRDRSSASSVRSRSWCSTSAPTSTFRSPRPPAGSSARCGRWRASGAFSPAARRRASCCRARRGSIFFTGRDGQPARRQGLRRIRGRQAGLAGARAEHGARARPENIHVAHLVIDAGVDTAFVRERIRAAGGDPDALPARHADGSGIDRRGVLAAAPAAARRLDASSSNSALPRDVVNAR